MGTASVDMPQPTIDGDRFVAALNGVDEETGEIPGQLEMTGHEAFVRPVPRQDVPMVRLSFSGSVDMTRDEFEAYTNGMQPSVGRIVYARIAAYLPGPHTAWVKRKGEKDSYGDTPVWWEPEGRLTLKAFEVAGLEITEREYSDGD